MADRAERCCRFARDRKDPDPFPRPRRFTSGGVVFPDVTAGGNVDRRLYSR